MSFVIQMAPRKAEGGSRTGRTRVARQRGHLGAKIAAADPRDTA
jgi:hypothetical protein